MVSWESLREPKPTLNFQTIDITIYIYAFVKFFVAVSSNSYRYLMALGQS